VTGTLHFEVHPCGTQELLIDPLPEGASHQGALYPDGAHIKDLKEVHDLLYKMQCHAIAPSVRVLPSSSSSLNLFIDGRHATTFCLVGVPARLAGKGPRPVP
jgi:xanthine dioxygenase